MSGGPQVADNDESPAARPRTPEARRELYLSRSADLRARAEIAISSNVRAELLKLAQQYEQLAADLTADLRR